MNNNLIKTLYNRLNSINGSKINIYSDGVNPNYQEELNRLINEYERVFGNRNPSYDEVFSYFRKKGYPYFVSKRLVEDVAHRGRLVPKYDLKTTNLKNEQLNLTDAQKGFIHWYYNRDVTPMNTRNLLNNPDINNLNIPTSDTAKLLASLNNTSSNLGDNNNPNLASSSLTNPNINPSSGTITNSGNITNPSPQKTEQIPGSNNNVQNTNSTLTSSNIPLSFLKTNNSALSYLPLLGIVTNALLSTNNRAFKIGESYAKMLMAERPEIRDATYVKFDEIKYNDRSQPLRNQLALQGYFLNKLAQNVSGGSAQNLMNIYQTNMMNRMQQLQNIENQEASRLDAINAQNVGIRNQQEQINKQYYDMNVTANEQNRARARDLNRLGYTTLFQLAQLRDQNMRTMMKDNLAWISDMQYNTKALENENLMKALFYQQLAGLKNKSGKVNYTFEEDNTNR